MGCNNSNTLPEPTSDIRKTISKIAPDKEPSSQKKIAKNVKNFQQFVDELRLMLKEDEFYDYLFRADYFQEMLDFMLQSYVNHQESMKIVSIILEYMALTKNFINGRHILKTNFKIDTLASQLSKRWTEIRAQVFFVNKNALKILNYLAYDLDQKKCWFSSSYLTLKFDFNQHEAETVARNTIQLCKYDERAFFYFSNYLAKACKTEYERFQAVTIVETRLAQILQDVSQHLATPLPLNGQDELFQHHRNFNTNSLDNPAFLLDLGKVKPNERVKVLQTFIVNKAKGSIQCINKFNHLFQSVCYQFQSSHYRSEVRLKSRSQKGQILKIKQQFLQFHPQKQALQQILKTNKDATLQKMVNDQYQNHRKQVDDFCQSQSGILKFRIYDMLRSQCMFNSLTKLNQCCSQILKEITKKGYKLIELSNRLRVGHEVPHILLRILIDNTLCEFKFVFQYNLGEFYFYHLLNEMTKSKYLSILTKLLLFNEQISNSFLLEAKEIIETNNNSKIQYGQRLNFSQIRPFFKELTKLLPFSFDQQRKAHISLDFNLIFEQIEQYKAIAEDFVNDQVKIDSTDKIRAIAQYLFYQKKFQLAEVLFSHYEKEIALNHTYLMDKIQHHSKEFIKSQMQLIEFYAESLHYLAKINKEKQAYSQSLEYYNKYLPLHTIVHKEASGKINILKDMAELHKLERNYDQAIKKYQECIKIQGKSDLSNVQINHQVAVIYRKQAKWEEALKYQTESLHIIQKDKGKDCLQYGRCLRHISDVFKQCNHHSQSLSRLEKSKQIFEKFQTRYTRNYAQIIRQLGLIEQKSENYSKALHYYQQSVEILSRLSGQQYEDSQKLYFRIGHLHLQMGIYKQAISKFTTCLNLANRISGSQSIQVSNILSNLGSAHQRLSEYEDAIPCFLKCSSIKKEKLGLKNIEYIRSMVNIGVIYDQSGKTQKALQTYKECLGLLADSNHNNNGDAAILLNNIGLIEHDRGDYSKALQKFDKALEIQEKIYGNDNKLYANTLSNIGLVKDDMCKYSQALVQYKKCLIIYQKLKHGKNQVAATYNNIGTTLLHLFDLKQALKYYQKCLVLEQSCNGKQSRSYSMCLYCIGLVKYKQNHLEQAEKYFEQSKSILKKLQCLNIIDYSQILVSFGKLCLQRRLIDQSFVYFDEAISIIEATSEPNPALMIEILLNKGIAFFRLKNYSESMNILQQAKHLCTKYQLKYREFALIYYNIGLIQMQNEQYFIAIKYLQTAMNLQQQFRDRHWKITACKLAVCSFMTLNQQKYRTYASYVEQQDGIDQNQHHMIDKLDKHK